LGSAGHAVRPGYRALRGYFDRAPFASDALQLRCSRMPVGAVLSGCPAVEDRSSKRNPASGRDRF